MTRFTFTEDFERDVLLTRAAIQSPGALFALCMRRPGFEGGPDAVLAYGDWMAHPDRRPYRQRIADELERRAAGQGETR